MIGNGLWLRRRKESDCYVRAFQINDDSSGLVLPRIELRSSMTFFCSGPQQSRASSISPPNVRFCLDGQMLDMIARRLAAS
jgi:hypothetical protein